MSTMCLLSNTKGIQNFSAAHCPFPPAGPPGGTVTLKHAGEVFSHCLGKASVFWIPFFLALTK